MHRIDPKYFDHLRLLELIRLHQVPPCLDPPAAKRQILNWMLQILGPN